jgi:hypothetical protein
MPGYPNMQGPYGGGWNPNDPYNMMGGGQVGGLYNTLNPVDDP